MLLYFCSNFILRGTGNLKNKNGGRFMKALFSLIALVAMMALSSQSHAVIRSMQVRGDKAKNLMEALAGAEYKVSMGDSYSDKPITIKTDAISCRYTVAQFPDEWESDAWCHQGDESQNNNPLLKNSLSLMKALTAIIAPEPALGSRYLSVSEISCVLSYDARAYSCDVSADIEER